MFDQGRSTFGSYKMFASLTVSMAFHLIRLKVTLRIKLIYLSQEEAIFDMLVPRWGWQAGAGLQRWEPGIATHAPLQGRVRGTATLNVNFPTKFHPTQVSLEKPAWAPRSTVQDGFDGALEVAKRPPAPRAFSHTATLDQQVSGFSWVNKQIVLEPRGQAEIQQWGRQWGLMSDQLQLAALIR